MGWEGAWGARECGAGCPRASPSPGLFPQPYPCAEDEECSADEYCASPARGAGAQICLACRKLRKRCMRHAMCCPGNHCKNGESGSSLSDSDHPLLARLQLRDNALSWGHFANGSSTCEVPQKDFRPVFNLEAKISTEVLERLYPFVPLDDLRGRLTSSGHFHENLSREPWYNLSMKMSREVELKETPRKSERAFSCLFHFSCRASDSSAR